MPTAAAISAVGSLGSAAIGYFGSKGASNAQQQFGQQVLLTQEQMFNTAKGGIQPVIDAGQGALSTGMGILNPAARALSGLLTPGPNMTETLSQIPGFKFAQDWGQKAVQNMGTTMGLGGNTLKAGADYATGVAQQGFQGIAGALQGLLNSGSGLVGSGLGAMGYGAGSLASAATQTGANMGGTLTGIGNAQASGILGGANALSGGLQGAAGGITNAMLLSRLLGGGAGGSLGAGGMGIYGGAPTSAATGSLY
jgi:hypothetical protein